MASFAASYLCVCTSTSALAWDVLHAYSGASPPIIANGSAQARTAGCEAFSAAEPLELEVALNLSLCTNPKSRQTWANVRAQESQVGQARAAYLPNVAGTWQALQDHASTQVPGLPDLSTNKRTNVRTAGLSLNWLIYDFGAREYSVDQAKHLAAAARATYGRALQETLFNTAKSYYNAQANLAVLEVAQDIEALTHKSLDAAQKRMRSGVAPISDVHQVRSANLQAVNARAKAEENYLSARGGLAANIGLRPDTPIRLPANKETLEARDTTVEQIELLLDETARSNLTLAAARDQELAAHAKVGVIKAQGLPSLGLIAKYSRNNQPANLGLSQLPASGSDWYVGLQLTVPIFEGFARQYKINEALAQAAAQEAAVLDAERQVALEVWAAYLAVRSDLESVANTKAMVETAQLAYTAAYRRYVSGVGGVLELLSVQNTLASAKQQAIQAVSAWHSDRVRLAYQVGTLLPEP